MKEGAPAVRLGAADQASQAQRAGASVTDTDRHGAEFARGLKGDEIAAKRQV